MDREIAKGLADVQRGRTYGPFDSAEKMAASIEPAIAKPRPPAKSKNRAIKAVPSIK